MMLAVLIHRWLLPDIAVPLKIHRIKMRLRGASHITIWCAAFLGTRYPVTLADYNLDQDNDAEVNLYRTVSS